MLNRLHEIYSPTGVILVCVPDIASIVTSNKTGSSHKLQIGFSTGAGDVIIIFDTSKNLVTAYESLRSAWSGFFDAVDGANQQAIENALGGMSGAVLDLGDEEPEGEMN